jgi:RNA recognition motif-containing protein
VHTNGSASATPKKKDSVLSKLFGWLTGKKKPEVKPYRAPTFSARPDFKERTPGAERVERRDRPERPERPDRPAREDRPPKAEPTPQEIVSPKLYVGNLAYEASESDLFDLFSKVGAVKNVEVAMDRRANRSKGFGFVEMESLETAKAAAEKLNRTDFMGRQIVVSGAKVDRRPIQSSQSAEPEAETSPAPQQESQPAGQEHPAEQPVEQPAEHQPEAGSSSSSSPGSTI